MIFFVLLLKLCAFLIKRALRGGFILDQFQLACGHTSMTYLRAGDCSGRVLLFSAWKPSFTNGHVGLFG